MNITKIFTTTVTAGALAGGICACGTASSHITPPASGGSYASNRALIAALAANGAKCKGPSPAGAYMDCGPSTVVSVQPDHAAALAEANRQDSPNENGGVAVVGVNWVISTDRAYASQVAAAIGGKIVSYIAPTFNNPATLAASMKTTWNTAANVAKDGYGVSSVVCIPNSGVNTDNCLLTESDGTTLDVTVTISADGKEWISHGGT